MKIEEYLRDETIDEVTRLQTLIALLGKAVREQDGGTIRYVDFDGETLTLEMGGACVGCPFAAITLHQQVEGMVKQFFPSVKEVKATFADGREEPPPTSAIE
jgi:Fe-S cluster biogenesis protein NfuA